MNYSDSLQYPAGVLSGNANWTRNDDDPSIVIAGPGDARGRPDADTGAFWKIPGVNASMSRMTLTVKFDGSPVGGSDFYAAWGSANRAFFFGFDTQIVDQNQPLNTAQTLVQADPINLQDTRATTPFTWGVVNTIGFVVIGSFFGMYINDTIASCGVVTKAALDGYATGGSFACVYIGASPDYTKWHWSSIAATDASTGIATTGDVTFPYTDGNLVLTGGWTRSDLTNVSSLAQGSFAVGATAQDSGAKLPNAFSGVDKTGNFALEAYFANLTGMQSSQDLHDAFFGDPNGNYLALQVDYGVGSGVGNDQASVSISDSASGSIGSIASAQWDLNHRMLATFESNVVTFYLDGTQIGTSTGTFNKSLFGPDLTLDAQTDGAQPNAVFFRIVSYAPPTISSTAAVSSTIFVTLSEACTLLDATKFSISGGTISGVTITAGTISGHTLTLSYTGTIKPGQTGTLTGASGAVKSKNSFLKNVSTSAAITKPLSKPSSLLLDDL